MAVPTDLVTLSAQDEGRLRVRLEPHHPVDDMYPGIFERLGPADVGFLVEASFELHEGSHLLAVTSGSDQRGNDRAVTRGAIQRLLDPEDIRVSCCLRDKRLH